MATLKWPDKDPDAVLDYQMDWSDWLNGDAISTSIWLVPSGLTNDSDNIASPAEATVIWLSGGTAGTTYELVNRITTTGGRTNDRTVKIKVKEL